MGDIVKSFLKCRQSMHKSFPGDYERKGKTCSAVRLFVKKKKSRLEIQLLRVFKDLTFLCECYKIINMNKGQSHLICNHINNSFCSFNVKLSML